MDFCKTKQPIALPIDSEGEGLLGANKEFDPELATNAPQQRECGKRCRFAKGTKGRKVIRRVGHFVLLSAFLYWVVSPSIKSYIHRGGHNLPDIKFSDFTDLDPVPGTVPEDFQWVGLQLPRNKHERLTGILGHFRFRRGTGMRPVRSLV